jgi:uncharacterized protein with HEPN domain
MKEGGRPLRQLLQNILVWGERLARFIDGISPDDFFGDELRQAAASKCIEAIGEASGEILRRYKRFATEHPQLDLFEAYRSRNRLSHGYDTIDSEMLWDTAAIYVPRLVADIRALTDGDVR